MDKLQWFKFSYADWRMGKIQRCSEVTQARFMNLCCLYWSKGGVLSFEDAEIEVEKENLAELIKRKVVLKSDEFISISFLDEQLIAIDETSKGKSRAAKVRWDKHKETKELEEMKNTGAMHVHKSALQNDAEKRREEKNREDKEKINKDKEVIFNQWLDYRIEIGKKIKSKQTLNSLIVRFNSEDQNKVKAVVAKSIENNYTGLFWDSIKTPANVRKPGGRVIPL